MHKPSAEHTACEKDLEMTLGHFILNNLITHVCKPGPLYSISLLKPTHFSPSSILTQAADHLHE